MKEAKKNGTPLQNKSSKQKTYPNIHSYISNMPTKRSGGFQDFLMDEFAEESKDNDDDQLDFLRNKSFSIAMEGIQKLSSSLMVEKEAEPKVRLADINTTIKDFTLYSEVTLYSTLPFTWLNRIVSYREHNQLEQEVPISQLWSPNLPQEEMFAKLNSKLRQKMGFYYFSSSTVEGTSDEEKSFLFQTYWSLWQSFTENNKRSFRLRSKATFTTFFQDTDHLRDTLKKHNGKLLDKLIDLKEQEPSKSVETKAPRLPETMHYAILGNLRGNISLVKALMSYGKSSD